MFVAAAMISVSAFAKKPAPVAVDAAKSTINWNAKKVTGEHSGTIKISKGEVSVDKGKLVGGSFDIDMASIVCTDLTDAGYNGKLIGHLKSDDFFSVAKHGTANLTVTKAVAKGGNSYELTGDLTIKGIKQAITFPATFDAKAGTGTATVKVDRTKYDIKYGSKSFFASIGDKAIDDEFTLTVNIVAGK